MFREAEKVGIGKFWLENFMRKGLGWLTRCLMSCNLPRMSLNLYTK
jgi:hypothetical protein